MTIIEYIATKSDLSGWLTAGATVVLVGITGFYAWQTKRTVDLMKKQNDIENKFKNMEMWERALEEFFIPFKGRMSGCSNIAFGPNPSGQDLLKNIEEAKSLLRYWQYRVFDSETTKTIYDYLSNMELYPGDVNNKINRQIFKKDCEFLNDLFITRIKSIKSSLRYKDLD